MQEQDQAAPSRASLQAMRALLVIGALCCLIELVLILSDWGLIARPFSRNLVYQNGAFWPGLLHGWRANYATQPLAMFLTYAFLHGGFSHLFGNMLTLWVLGRIVIREVGEQGFLVIYVVSALGGAALFGLLSASPQPMVGASGALFGLAGAWQFWTYRTRLKNRFWALVQAFAIQVVLNLGLWVLMDGRLAWQTHLGGFLAGWGMAWVLAAWRR